MRYFTLDELEIGQKVYMEYFNQLAYVKVKNDKQVAILNDIYSPHRWGTNLKDTIINVSYNTLLTSKPFNVEDGIPKLIGNGIIN